MEIATKIAPTGLAIIMLTLGLGLTLQDFLRVFKTPKEFLIGFVLAEYPFGLTKINETPTLYTYLA